MAIFRAPGRDATEKFYDDLIAGQVSRGLWGADSRFDGLALSAKPSVQQYFAGRVAEYLDSSMRVLDYGCGTGGFSMAMAPLVDQVEAVDISARFVEAGKEAVARSGQTNINIRKIGASLPFDSGSFDALVMVDLLHHLDDIEDTLTESMRVLRPGGRLLVFEPNKYNFLLSLMCLLDRNEWGLLSLGTPPVYRRLLAPYIDIDRLEFNGLLLGPESRLALGIADQLDHGLLAPLFKWLSPKIFVAGCKR